ncbi:tripartite tricarboxylate transporter substrate binding protein [Variovorax sp. J22R133]|uniref:Bug family tripartite tricarboxylate transporter substrate binding protein n=1 Tax=Variovorax brevis TaxID=3053503 RepID=UPI0025749889|nr:tripartite tricarboxylate transporter substrate binding protein [Variovorax sp. J22R133]MDM0118149.1 tripartite tricarboxylate transporter substrate binding protein [Variovorax sp. J22R133]
MQFVPTRRATLALVGAACLLGTSAFAQNKPITVIVPYAPGGSADLVTRVIAQFAAPGIGSAVIVDNKTGGGGVVGWSAAARAAPDGNTLLTVELSYAIAAGLIPTLPFDPKKAFTQITTAVKVPHVLVVNPAVPAKTVQEFIALAKAQPGKLNYGSGGNGTNTHLAGELFKSTTGTDIVHVAYKGAGAVLTDLMGNQVQALITSVPTALPHIKSGKLKALMVTGSERNAMLPDVPTAKEAGIPRMDIDYWIGIGAPAGTPQPVIDKLNKEFNAALAQPDAKKKIAEMGLTVVANTPAQATQLVNSEIQRWSAVIKQAGIKAD